MFEKILLFKKSKKLHYFFKKILFQAVTKSYCKLLYLKKVLQY